LRMSFRDSSEIAVPTQSIFYDPWGLSMKGMQTNRNPSNFNHFQFNSKEIDLATGYNDYGARLYNSQTGRWNIIDQKSDEYYGTSPFVFVLNSPTIAIDPDGKRVYFVGGAGNDTDGWNYIGRWGQAFKQAGIDFYRVNASHGKGGDILFTSSYRDNGYENVSNPPNMQNYNAGLMPVNENTGARRLVKEEKIDATVSLYKKQLIDNPLASGEQFNLAGYSYGSVLQAQAALQLATDGQIIDNLILIGSPISDKSELWKQLKSNKNIKNVIRYDIDGDALSNPQGIYDYFINGGFMQGALQGDNAHHFDAARPGQSTNDLINVIIQWLQQQGVKN
jgi:RHS repeat-associated protein